MKVRYDERKYYKSERNGKCPQLFYTTKYSKMCEYPHCTKQPSFAPPGHHYLRCKKHSLPGDVNVRAKKCQHDGCEITPAFGPPGQNKGFRCLKHKLDTDINVKKKYCEVIDCNITASFGPKGTRKMIRCYEHRLIDDVNTKRLPDEESDEDEFENDSNEENSVPKIQEVIQKKRKIKVHKPVIQETVEEIVEDISD